MSDCCLSCYKCHAFTYGIQEVHSLFLLQLLVIGLSVMDGIDPNPENFVSAGIVKSKEIMIGCLVRLEPNKEKKVLLLIVV